ncbi:glycosyl hydrolase, partial [Haloferula sp.]|uniref:glycosyl hydrolase n=1 Tax=Haloferula sp. TaxID=2497595 RepID=UPI003C7880EB
MLRLLALLASLVAPLWAHDAEWPEVTQNHRPLVRWWWPSDLSALSEPGPELESMARAGFGGVEILPSPPARGGPPSELEWLAQAWVERYALASETAERLGLRLDLSCNGPAPGNLPAISPYESAFRSVPILATTRGGPFELVLPPGSIDCLGAWPPHGPPIDLRPFINLSEQSLKWQAPPGTWNIYGIGRDPANYPDHFSTNTASQSLARYAEAFIDSTAPFPRAYSLSFSELDADWSSALVAAFQRRRGYDLREQLPELYGDANAGTVERVLSDYRETLADLRRDTLITWHKWTHDQGALSRSQVKGIFGNPIDLQGVPDIPGVIVSGIPTDDDLPLLAFASSAAHLHTKPLVAATLLHETADPERITPSQMKESVDLLWLAGANQIQLDGILSGPAPDRLRTMLDTPFTPLGPGSGRGENMASFNAYITRCQSILQSGAPDPEVLIYYPFHDLLTERGGIPADPAKQNEWFRPTSFHRSARTLLTNGIPCDYASDLLLENATVSQGKIILGGLTYKTLIIPEVRQLPENTARQILALTRRGASITILGDWPRDVPGFPMPDIR